FVSVSFISSGIRAIGLRVATIRLYFRSRVGLIGHELRVSTSFEIDEVSRPISLMLDAAVRVRDSSESYLLPAVRPGCEKMHHLLVAGLRYFHPELVLSAGGVAISKTGNAFPGQFSDSGQLLLVG